jgi:hypothetical protein
MTATIETTKDELITELIDLIDRLCKVAKELELEKQEIVRAINQTWEEN